MTPEQIEMMARENLSNYEGYEGYEGENYVGENDDMVDFGGQNKSFVSEFDQKRTFTFSVTNAAVADRNLYLFSGTDNPTGSITDGAFNDISNAAGLTATGSPQTIELLKAFYRYNPSRILGVKVSSTSTLQISTSFTIQPMSPFRTLESTIIQLGSYQDENTFQNNVVTIPFENLQADGQQRVSISIPAGATTTFIWFFGAVLNTAAALEKKASKAHANIARMGGVNAVRNMQARRPVAGRNVAPNRLLPKR